MRKMPNNNLCFFSYSISTTEADADCNCQNKCRMPAASGQLTAGHDSSTTARSESAATLRGKRYQKLSPQNGRSPCGY